MSETRRDLTNKKQCGTLVQYDKQRQEKQMEQIEIRIPSRFYYDHKNRDLPAGEAIKDYANGQTLIRATESEIAEILDDAEFYVEMGPEFGPDLFGLIQSAKATVRAINKQTGE
jgi:hypothetical protein